jgi:predicted transcriptional regulator
VADSLERQALIIRIINVNLTSDYKKILMMLSGRPRGENIENILTKSKLKKESVLSYVKELIDYKLIIKSKVRYKLTLSGKKELKNNQVMQ